MDIAPILNIAHFVDMKLPIIVVKGRPVSVNSSTKNKELWKSQVAKAASAVFGKPLKDTDLRIVITFFHNTMLDFDTDNISKPICDCLKGIVYIDDLQIMERFARRRAIDGPFHIKGIEPEVAIAIAEGDDFISIKIEKIGQGVTQI